MDKTFDIHKDLNLGFLGKEWEQCSITFRAMGMEELRKYLVEASELESKLEQEAASTTKKAIANIDDTMKVLKEKFVQGTAISAGNVVPLEAEDLPKLAPEVLRKSYDLVSGTPDPN